MSPSDAPTTQASPVEALFTPEPRVAREAAFHLIQAQTPGVRVAQLAAFAS